MKKLILFVLVVMSINVQANRFVSEPACFIPNKPLFFSPKSYILRYQQDVKEYRKCVYKFISQQKQQIRLHEESIRQAKELLEMHVN